MATDATETTNTETPAEGFGAAGGTAATMTAAEAPAATANAGEEPRLDFEAAGDILDEAGSGNSARADGALAERREADPLADSEDTDPLADDGGGLDDLLADDPDGTGDEDDVDGAGDADDAGEQPDGAEGRAAADYSKLPPRIAAIMRHADAAGCSFEDAEAAIFGGAANGGDGGMGRQDVRGLDFGEVERELEMLRAERRRAAEDFTNPTRALELTEQIEARQLVLATERARQQMREAERTAAREQHTAAVLGEMEARFPGAFVPGHRLHDAILADRNRILQSNPAFFADPDWAETLVRKHASRLGIASTKPGATASRAALAAAAPPKKSARPLPAPGGRSATPNQLTEAGMSKAIRAAQARGDAATLDFILRHGRVPAAA